MPLRRRGDPRTALLPWHRRWVRQGELVPVDAHGFLALDEGTLLTGRRGPNASLLTLADVADVACVVALGDPGLGKSTALQAHVEWLRARDPSARIIAHDLADLASVEALGAGIF